MRSRSANGFSKGKKDETGLLDSLLRRSFGITAPCKSGESLELFGHESVFNGGIKCFGKYAVVSGSECDVKLLILSRRLLFSFPGRQIIKTFYRPHYGSPQLWSVSFLLYIWGLPQKSPTGVIKPQVGRQELLETLRF
jgi:hypothetical protein